MMTLKRWMEKTKPSSVSYQMNFTLIFAPGSYNSSITMDSLYTNSITEAHHHEPAFVSTPFEAGPWRNDTCHTSLFISCSPRLTSRFDTVKHCLLRVISSTMYRFSCYEALLLLDMHLSFVC